MWQTASGTPHSNASATPVNGWRRASPRSLWRLLPSGPSSYSSSLPTSARIAPAITVSRSMGKARPMNSCMAWALWRAMWTTQRLCSMKVIGQFGTSSVNGMRFRSSGFRGLRSQRLDPGLRDLVAQLPVFDPLNLRPKLNDCLVHEVRPPVQNYSAYRGDAVGVEWRERIDGGR